MDGEVDEPLHEFMDNSVWEFLFRDTMQALNSIDNTDALFRKLPVESFTDTVSTNGGCVSGPTECSVIEFWTTNNKELKRLVRNKYNSKTSARPRADYNDFKNRH